MKGNYRTKHNKNMGHTRHRRLLSLLLCFCIFMEVLPIQTITTLAASNIDSVVVTYEGSATEKVILPQNEKVTLAAKCSPVSNTISYQWQILADIKKEVWVNIYGAVDQSISLSYAMLASLLDESGSAYIRCKASVGDDGKVSAPVCVTVSYDTTSISDTVSISETATMPNIGKKSRKAAKKTLERNSLFGAIARALEGTPEYVDISIHYLDEVTGQPIYTSFTAQIAYGTAYANTVVSPTYLGYAPYYNAAADPSVSTGDADAAKDDAATIQLNIPETYDKDSYTVNVYYKAIDVSYGVRYYFQNIHDDGYSEDVNLYRTANAKTGTIITDADLEVQDPDKIKGFTKLYHHSEPIAADSSTIFECYYDRNYYMFRFDMDGGYGTEPIYARYGMPVVVNNPTRHGYVFLGWDDVTDGVGDGIADVLPDTITDGNRIYKALWEKNATTYTTVYWLQNANDDDYSYIGSVKENAQSGDVVSGSNNLTATTSFCGEDHPHTSDCYPPDFKQYVYKTADENVTVKGDGSTIVNVYYDRKEYTLRFFYARAKYGRYQVVGGSTYYFGNPDFSRPTTYNVENLLAQVPGSQWGRVKNLPKIKEQYAGKYTTGTLTDDTRGYTYYYFELRGRFDEDLSNTWPGEALEPIEVNEIHISNGGLFNMGSGKWGNYAYLSGWNGEFKVKYSKEHSNSTIKGVFQKLGEDLIYDSSEGTSDIVNFLGFFDNGADISWSIPRQWIYQLYVPTLPGETADLTYEGVSYKLFKSVDASDDCTTIADQTQPTLYGFTPTGRNQITNSSLSDDRESYTAQFFYSRNSYNLTMYNYNETLLQEQVPYQTSLDAYNANIPDYPSTLEEGAYEFGGWYYSPGCYPGSEYQVGDTMPAKNVALYAKWIPITHTVRFFQTYDDMLAYEANGTKTGLIETRQVVHGNALEAVDDPVDQDYTFKGWFFIREGNKIAYVPTDMPVTGDRNVFADWGSQSAQPYRIHYALQEAETDTVWTNLLGVASGGTPQDNRSYTVTNDGVERTYVYLNSDRNYHLLIAPDSNGFAYQGNTRTFFPKVGEPLNQLYPGYNTGYFPTISSHSMSVAQEENENDPVRNVFTFTYEYKPSISYTVEYRYLDTNQLIGSAPGGGRVTKDSSKSVVTERFAPIADYIPDAFYKRLILTVGVENKVVFYYKKSTQNAYYAVHYMLQKLDADSDSIATDLEGNYINYTESDVTAEGIGEADAIQKIIPQSFTGFSLKNEAHVKGVGNIALKEAQTNPHFEITIQSSGTELYVFYTRNIQEYKIYHLEYGTDISNLSSLTDDSKGVLRPIVTKTGKFESSVSATAETIDGMNCVSNQSQTIWLRADNAQNYIIFYYESLQYSVEYKVSPQDGGTLSQTIETQKGVNPFAGSTATAKNGYRFDGWYLDEEGTVPVGDKGTITGSKLVPVNTKLNPAPAVNVFYAKFTPAFGNLTIVRENGSKDEGNANRVFVYRITATDDPDFELFVSIKGDGSVTIKDLPCGEYNIEQQNDWSWRYGDVAKKETVLEIGSTVTFGGNPTKEKWLNGNSEKMINKRDKDKK